MSTAATSRFIAFFDECGDHSLENIDRDFPLFVLSTVVFDRSDYVATVVPALTRLKLNSWPHEGVNLHSRDIRKAHGDFAFLQARPRRLAFLGALSAMLDSIPFTLFITAIHKQSHRDRGGPQAGNPYDLALALTLERVLHFLEGHGEATLPFTAEARGKNEDNELSAAFAHCLTQGTGSIAAARFQTLVCPLTFRRKSDNVAGMQVADLCAHPSARHVLNPGQPNQAHDIVARHLYRRDGVCGWRLFP